LERLPEPQRPTLVLAGEAARDGYRAEIERAAAAAGVSDRVRLAGTLEDMPAAYLAADLVVAPSTQPESFGRAPVEAMAMGRPVLAAGHGAFAETVVHGQTGWLAPPGDGEAWTRALAAALGAAAADRAAMGQAGRRRVKQLYSLAAMCEATFAVYRGVLENRA
jgi:glycosyltransferase involved in cell wall biosynthesis